MAKPEEQFDFWLGEWDLTWESEGETGKGTNHIRRVLGDKIIEENFDGTPDIELIGRSYSAYHAETSLWQQTWVDNNGSYLDFKGQFSDGKMVLERDAVREGKTFRQRMVWFDITASAFEWHWQRSDDGGATWDTLWHISYQRKK